MKSHIICRSVFKLDGADRFLKNLGMLISQECNADFFYNLYRNTHQHFLEYDLGGLVYSIYLNQAQQMADLPQPPHQYRSAYLQNVRYNHILIAEAQRIIKAAKGLKVLAIQGIAHLLISYEDSGARTLRDMDFLVARKDMVPFIELLMKMGYTVVRDEAFFSFDYDGHVELRGKTGAYKVLVDVSSYTRLPANLMTDVIRCRLNDILDQAQITASGIVVPHCADLALLTLLNLERKEYTSIKGWLDFVTMTHGFMNGLDWQRFVRMIEAPGARRIIKRQLEFCHQHLRADIPRTVINQLSVRTGFADDGWLSFFMDPKIILNRRGRAINNLQRRPSLRSLLLGLARRMTAFDFPDRERKWLRLVFTDSNLVTDYLYRARHTITKQLVRYIVNPMVIITGYFLAQAAHLGAGAYFYCRYGLLGRALRLCGWLRNAVAQR